MQIFQQIGNKGGFMYIIDRIEIVNNRDGFDELFFNININDDLGDYSFAKWITEEEFNNYKNGEIGIDEIIENYLPIARENKIKSQEILKNYINNQEPFLE